MTNATRQPDKPRSSSEPELDESTRTFLRLAIMAILGGALAFIAVILIFAPDQVRRLANPLAGIGIALTSWALLKKEHFRASIMVLTVGTWLVTTAIAISSGGVRTPVVYSLPVIVFFAGWLLGSRMAIAMAILSVTTYLAMAILEHQGRLPQIPYTPAFMHWVIQATIIAIAAAAIVYLRNSHARQVEEVRALTTELTKQRAEAEAAQALKDSLNNLQCTLEATDEGIFGYDGHDQSGKLLFANDRFFDIWNISRMSGQAPVAPKSSPPRASSSSIPMPTSSALERYWQWAWCMKTR